MKIIYIINGRIPTEKAYGHQICKMCERFSFLGHDVKLWAPRRKGVVTQDLFEYYGIKKSFEFKIIKSFDFISYSKYLGRLGFYLQTVFFLFILFFKKIDKESLIYTRNTTIAWLFKIKKFKVAYECHDWFAGRKFLALFFLKKVDYIITTNKYIKEEFFKNNFSEQRILVAPNGADLDIFGVNISKEEAIAELQISSELKNKLKENKVILYTGSFKTNGVEKGLDEILEAVAKIKKNILFFAVGGNKNDIDFYNQKKEALKISDHAFLLPRVSQEELAKFQKAADILLMPFPDKAHYRHHMAPLKMFEYMCAHRPIIASDLPSIRAVLTEKTAFFVKPGDVDDLLGAINRLTDDGSLAEDLAKNALEESCHHSWTARAEKILKFINVNE